MTELPDVTTVVAARAGDPAALDRLVRQSLPLVYTVVGHALGGHVDTDDVVQETMLRVLRRLDGLREPLRYRSWLVAIAIRLIRDRYRDHRPADALVDDRADPGADFADRTVARLELSGQRRETAHATRWLDPDDRELLALWWLETAGRLTRDDVVAAVDQPRPHVAVRIQRMKARLDTARTVVRALAARPGCPDLLFAADWDGRAHPLWRKRFARHIRDCAACAPARTGLVATDRLLTGLGLVAPPPALLDSTLTAAAVPAAPPTSTGGAPTGTAAPAPTGTAAPGAEPTGIAAAGSARRRGGAHADADRRVSARRRIALVGAAVGVLVTCALVAVIALRGGQLAPATAAAQGDPAAAARPGGFPTAGTTPTPVTASASVAPSPGLAPPGPSVGPTAKSRPAPEGRPAATTPKKGVATWEFSGVKGALADVGASWYYNWSATDDRTPGPAGVEFVPMIWGAANVTDATLAQAKREGDVLLGFNEPDLAGQAEMSVAKALDLWPRLESTGLPLGSPAVAFGADTPGGWLDRFMGGAKERGLRIDFIALHWYGSDFGPAAVGHLRDYLNAVHRRYGKPIWLTEYGLMNFSGNPKHPDAAQLTAFIRGSTRMLEGLPYLRRYAWFGLPATGDSAAFGLYRDAGTPTSAGGAYRDAGRR